MTFDWHTEYARTNTAATPSAADVIADIQRAAKKLWETPTKAPTYIHNSKCAAVVSGDLKDCNCAVMGRS